MQFHSIPIICSIGRRKILMQLFVKNWDVTQFKLREDTACTKEGRQTYLLLVLQALGSFWPGWKSTSKGAQIQQATVKLENNSSCLQSPPKNCLHLVETTWNEQCPLSDQTKWPVQRLYLGFYKKKIKKKKTSHISFMNEMNTYVPPNIRLITRSLSFFHPMEDSQPMSCLPG